VLQNTLGTIAYEITNYPPVVGRSLGSVNVVISDRKIWVNPTFKSCIVSRTDYFQCTCPPFWRRMLNNTCFSGTESLSGVNPKWNFSGTEGEIGNRTTVGTYRFGYNGLISD
jgi:hypothetical protein